MLDGNAVLLGNVIAGFHGGAVFLGNAIAGFHDGAVLLGNVIAGDRTHCNGGFRVVVADGGAVLLGECHCR